MHIEEMDMEVEWNEEMERIWFYQKSEAKRS